MDCEKYLPELERLSDYRRTHSLNVADEAVHLARKYGADCEKARLAGLLHDVTKELSAEEQLKILSDGGVVLTDVERASEKLWHAVSGSVYVRDKIGIKDDDILNAIRYHTTARAGMSVLEKVVFLADFTSADRTYPDIGVIRACAERSLDEGVLYALQYTISRLASRGSLISPDALFAYNEILLSAHSSSRAVLDRTD